MTGEGVRGHVVVEPVVVSVGKQRIFAPLFARAPPPPSPGLPGSFVAQGQRTHATVRERVKMGETTSINVCQKGYCLSSLYNSCFMPNKECKHLIVSKIKYHG